MRDFDVANWVGLKTRCVEDGGSGHGVEDPMRRGRRIGAPAVFISGRNHARNRAGEDGFCGRVKPYSTVLYERSIIWFLCDLSGILADTGAMTPARFATGSGGMLPEKLKARLTPMWLAHEQIQRDFGRGSSGAGEAGRDG